MPRMRTLCFGNSHPPPRAQGPTIREMLPYDATWAFHARSLFGEIGIIGHMLGVYGDIGKENGNYYNGLYRGCRAYIWGSMGIMEKKMETLGPFKGICRVLWGFIGGYILGLYGDNGKENGNHYNLI